MSQKWKLPEKKNDKCRDSIISPNEMGDQEIKSIQSLYHDFQGLSWTSVDNSHATFPDALLVGHSWLSNNSLS